jgi:arylsulfatase A-like enzyme
VVRILPFSHAPPPPAPRIQYDPPQRFIDDISASDLRPVYTCDAADPLAWDAIFANNSNGCGPKNLDAWCGTMPANESEFARRCYQGSISFIDEWVGKIFDALTATKQLENTWIIWTADHGDGQSDHFHWRKGFPYEFSSHVPFMIRWPEGSTDPRLAAWSRGSVFDKQVVELRDIFPTFLDAAGASNLPPADYQVRRARVVGVVRRTPRMGRGCRGTVSSAQYCMRQVAPSHDASLSGSFTDGRRLAALSLEWRTRTQRLPRRSVAAVA